MTTTKLKPTWWCEPDFFPGVTVLRAEVHLGDGALLSGSNLVPNNAERFVLEEMIANLEYAFERHHRIRVR